jgi:hypothetical protein
MKNLISKEEKDRIDLICKKFHIRHYTIISDGSIDVNGDVYFASRDFIKLPLNFNIVSGELDCRSNRLTTLEGCPHTVDSSFICYNNDLTSLTGGPHTVGGDFECYKNQLSTLEGAPHTIGGNLICSYNNLVSTYAGDVDIEVDGIVSITDNLLPELLMDHMDHIKLILKYQRHFFIWNDDLSLNEENFADLIAEIKDGLE